MNLNVLRAVFKRNLLGYLANPTGYLFICAFVVLTELAAFWPNDFFNNNLANLDQLNGGNLYLNFFTIMLLFVPAITMGIWSDERRQGTDELLLTMPASDFDIVLGKYLAAVAIYTAALLFSLVCNYLVLNTLANPNPGFSPHVYVDLGLLVATYFGYWLVGLAMLAIGMVASFLTSNVTIAFILAGVFNAPLVLAAAADTMMSPDRAIAVKRWSMQGQFADFSRGVFSTAATAYFLLIVAAMLYVSMILIARRHWRSGWNSQWMTLHYAIRIVSLPVIVGCVVAMWHWHDLRRDMTRDRLSSLSKETEQLLADLKLDRPVQIEAFISPTVPENYIQTRLNLLTMLDELKARGGPKLHVSVINTERFSEEADRAEHRYGITPRTVETQVQGVRSEDQIFLGVAMTCGAQQKVTLPFIDRGIPVEYELVRSLCTVAQEKRKRLGVVLTDAHLFGQMNFSMQGPSNESNWRIIDELQKQYEVVQVNPSEPITEKCDVLLAVQPSSLGPQEMENFIKAVRSGRPTAIFEDPCPTWCPVPGTVDPRPQPNNMMMGMGRQSLPKGNIEPLWDLLGVRFVPDRIIWQKYNPYRKQSDVIPPELVFVDRNEGNTEPFASDPVSRGLQQVVFPFPGAIEPQHASDLTFTPLITTGQQTGTVEHDQIVQSDFRGRRLNPNPKREPTRTGYVLAARIHGKPKPAAEADVASDPKSAKSKPKTKSAEPEINVVLATDVDMMADMFFMFREVGELQPGMKFEFDNVTFVLNLLDALAGEERFIAVRSRRPNYCTLAQIEAQTQKAKDEETEATEKANREFDEKKKREQKLIDEKLASLQKRVDAETVTEFVIAKADADARLKSINEQLARQRDREVTRINRQLKSEVGRVQKLYKMWAILLPPILPLLLGVVVFATRRAREREGVPRKRLR